MKFALLVDCDNAAFEDHAELAAILRALSIVLDETAVEDILAGKIVDSNGNTVGVYAMEEDVPMPKVHLDGDEFHIGL